MNDPVDVLIIGAGASGAAVAWSLAETKMHILCLEQGGWMNPVQYPSVGRDWEARAYGDYSPSPNIRARPEDYPVNDDNSPIKVVNFNGVGGSTVMYTAHFPRLHPSDFRVRTLDGVAEDWPIDYDTLAPFFAENDRIMGVSGLAGDPAFPSTDPPMPPHWPLRDPSGEGDEQARLALVAVRYHGGNRRLRGARAMHQSRPLHAGMRAGRKGEHRHHLLAGGVARRRRASHALPGARDHHQ
jgi:choline dehydrogenase-like flavoprotein